MKRLLSCLLLLGGMVLRAQDCSQSLVFTGAANGTVVAANSGGANGCTTWRLTWFVTGFTAATVALQGSQDNVTFANITTAANILDGSNPTAWTSSTVSNSVAIRAYFPYYRVAVSSLTGSGSINTLLLGYKGTSASVGSTMVTISGNPNVNIAQVAGTNTVTGGVAGLLGVGGSAADGATATGNPVLIGGHDTGTPSLAHVVQTDTFGDVVLAGVSAAQSDGSSNTPTIPGLGTSGAPVPSTNRSFPFDFNGATWDRHFACTSQATVTLSGTSATQIVAGTAAQTIRVCKIFVTSAAAGAPVVNTFTVSTGTCAAAPTTLLIGAAITGLDSDFGGALRSSSGGALCLAESTANSDVVTVTYVKY